MKEIKLAHKLLLLFLLTVNWLLVTNFAYSSEIIYAAGRGEKENGTIWQYTDGKWSVHSVIPHCSELFILLVDKKGNLLAGGNYYAYGTVWKYGKEGWDKGVKLSGCRGLYALAEDNNGNIWAGGSGTENIWMFNGNNWDAGTTLDGCVGIYSLVCGTDGDVWAGGEGKTQIWKYNGSKWDGGTKLSDYTDLFTLAVDSKGMVWAGGRGGSVLWRYPAKESDLFVQNEKNRKWSTGLILLDSTEISGFTVNKKNGIYAAGAGINKIWFKDDKSDWVGINLNECIAIYSITAGNSAVFAGGWNAARRGRIWKGEGGVWNEGTDIPDCYVIRSLVVSEK